MDIPDVFPRDRMSTAQKLILILQDNPGMRDSYDLLVNEFYRRNSNSKLKKETIERNIRFLQYDLGIYPPTERVRKARKQKQKEIIERAKVKTEGFF